MRLHHELPRMSWREFQQLVRGLLTADTRLSRAMTAKYKEEGSG